MAFANIPGGGTGTGPNVTVTDNGDGTVTIANGIVSIVIVKQSGRLNEVNYTHKNSGAPQTSEVLQGRGQYYYGGFMLGSGVYDYSLATDPASNGGQYADARLISSTDKNGVMEIHFSMLRGSPGFYSTAIMTHRREDAKFEVGAWGVVTRVTPDFNWLSADATRNFLIGDRSNSGVKVPNSPHEITVNLNGSPQGEYADKFVYGQDHADLRAWGWSSVGPGKLNVGMWMMTNMEFSDGGPMKRDVSVYPYAELNNSILTGEIGMGSDGHLSDGEVWMKTCGPWFIYLNEVPSTVTGARDAAQMLYQDALAQAEAEKQAWPYDWFKHPNYVSASGRGTVSGKIVINDSGNPNASAAGTWVGLEQQPQTNNGTHDFQKWLKPYQFWVQADRTGRFTIPNVIAGDNYTLWAYGPGAAGTLLSQNQTGGNPPWECDLPAKAFSVKVTPRTRTELPTVTWTPVRVGPTVFELGCPNRKADEFRHGEDYWAPGVSPKLGYPTPVWGGQMEFPLDFPDGMNYTVGKSRWATDWNYVLPSAPDTAGAYQPCTGKITFNLSKEPASGAMASIYIGCAGDDGGHVIVSVNDTNLGGATGVTAASNPIDAAGYNPSFTDDSSIHFSVHGPFSDERINFPGKMLHAGQNTITIQMDARSLTAYLMVDYLRLELTGYVPPAPSSVTAYPGNNHVLVCWPVVPGATSYNILRSRTSGAKYFPIKTGAIGPVSGSGPRRAMITDTSAVNGTEYYYAVQSVNPTGVSVPSPPSAGVTPSPGLVSNAPSAPAGLKIIGSGHHRVALSWTASPGADYYTIWRATLHADGAGGAYPVGTILLDDTTTGTGYVDRSPTDGRAYRYYVRAASAKGTSGPSEAVTARPLPAPPATAPEALTGKWTKMRAGSSITLSWSAVPGATGYVVYRSTGHTPTFHWPENFLTALVETTYVDKGNTEKGAKVIGLDNTIDFFYQVTAVNEAGISPPATIQVAALAALHAAEIGGIPESRSPRGEAGGLADKNPKDLRSQPDPALPIVLLIGDSISVGYTLLVRHLLEGTANVFRPLNADGTAENCADTGYGLAELERWLAIRPKWDVIHFNWGLHDLKHMKKDASEPTISNDPNDPPLRTVGDYRANLEKIVVRLQQTGARLVFATTTPVPEGCTSPFRSPDDPPRYNAAAIEVMDAQDICVDDLFTLVQPRLAEWQEHQNVHFTAAGSVGMAAQVAQMIASELEVKR